MTHRLRVFTIAACCFIDSSVFGGTLLEIRSGLKTLHQVQDEIATGAPDASQLQSAILKRLTEIFENSPQALLANPEYQSALAELALSGGDQKRMAKLIRLSLGSAEDPRLLLGIEAYFAGQMEKAATAIEQTEGSESNTPGFEHFLALAEGTALLETDIAKARDSFETALLYAPGTLVEEVALRRLTRISLKLKDANLFIRCAALYIRRYSNSPFASEFLSGFAQGTRLVTRPDDLARLEDLVALLPAATARNLLVQAAKNFLADGKVSFAARFTARLRDGKLFDEKPSAEVAETQILELLVDLKRKPTPEMWLYLQNIDGPTAGLDARKLSEIAKHVLWNLHKPLSRSSSSEGASIAASAESSDGLSDVDQILSRAKIALESGYKAETP